MTEQRLNVLFLNELKFEIFSDNCQPTVKHGGGSVILWRCYAGDTIAGSRTWVVMKQCLMKTYYIAYLCR